MNAPSHATPPHATPHMSLTLRAAVAADYEAISHWVSNSAQCAHWAGPHMPFPFSGAELPGLIAASRGIVAGESASNFSLVDGRAESPDAIGFGQLIQESPTEFRLARIIIAPERRGQGLGAVLCRLLIGRAGRIPGAQLVKLYVYRGNAPAHRLYTKLGFVEAPIPSRSDVLAMQRAIDLPVPGW